MDDIEILNWVGGIGGRNGMPELLPGLNFIQGLKGETKETFDLNFQFLQRLLDSDLKVRRINIRQVMAFPGTPMWREERKNNYHNQFLKFKDKVRKQIDFPMLNRVVPVGTVLKDVLCEVHDGITFGRQLASYPLLIGIPSKLTLGRFIDVTVTGHGQRSITGIPYPLDINNADPGLISQLPGVGKKRTTSIVKGRPYKDQHELFGKIENIEEILQYIIIE